MFWKSIGFKLIFLIVVFSSACVGIYVYMIDKDSRAHYESDLMSQAYEVARRISLDVREGMLLHGDNNTGTSLKNIGYQKIVRRVRILDKNGRIAASTEQKEMGRLVARDDPFCRNCHKKMRATSSVNRVGDKAVCYTNLSSGERIANIVVTIPNKPDCATSRCHAHGKGEGTLGLVDVEITMKSADKRLADRRNKSILFAATLMLGLTAAGSLFTYKIIYVPLREVIRGTKDVASGKLDTPIAVINQDDEIGYLAHSFNKMTSRIREMNQSLNEMNIELERKVEERTLELKKSQETVLQSEKLASLGLMAAAIAHEINNPLTAVLTYSSLLCRDAEQGTEMKEDLEVVVSEATRCREIVRGLLDFARETDFRLRQVNINTLLDETIALVAHQVTFQNIIIKKNFANYIPDTIMDADQMKQVFLNIMLNAADSMPNGGKLRLRTSFDYELNEITIEFQDTGVGISERDVNKIFDPFFTTKAKGKGTGLGLSVSYGIVQRHGGTIDVKSTVGKGTSFFLAFPMSPTGR